jgi:hypothetical protein
MRKETGVKMKSVHAATATGGKESPIKTNHKLQTTKLLQ